MKGIKKYDRIIDGNIQANKYGRFTLNMLFNKLERKMKNKLIEENN